MRLERLEVENFGLFSGVDFAFADGFQLIYGPNEAGKSTLLQLIREVLFGFPSRSPYAFASHAGEMAATVTLRMADDTALRYRRRKGRKDAVVGEVGTDRRPLDAAGLTRLLGGANLELYEQVFGFSLAELASGQQGLKQANLNEALYGGGLGGLANFQQVQAEMKAEAEALFTSRGTQKPINRVVRQIKEAGKAQRKAMIKPAEYKKQVARCEELCQQVEEARARLEEKQARAAHLQRIADALEPWLRLRQAREKLKSIDVPGEIAPDAFDELKRKKQRRDDLQGNVDQAEEDLREKRNELSQIELRPELLEVESRIRSLNQRLAEVAGYRRDLPTRRTESEAIKSSVLTKLRELNPDWDYTHLESFRTSLEQRETVERLEQQWDELMQRRAKLEARRDHLKNAIVRHERGLEKLTDTASSERLEAIVEAEAEYRANLKALEKQQSAAKKLKRVIAEETDRLNGPLQTTLPPVSSLPVPLEATITDFARRWEDATESVRQAKSDLDGLRKELEQRRQELDSLEARQAVPDRQQLLELRERRDQGWSLIRRKYVDGQTVTQDEILVWTGGESKSPADEYEQAVRETDAIADERQEKAQAAAERDELIRQVNRLEDRVREAESRLVKQQTAAETLKTEWNAAWQNCPFEPLAPAAMQQWRRSYDELLGKQQQLADMLDEQSTLEQKVDAYESRLRAQFPDLAEEIESLLARAKKMVKDARDAAASRKAIAEELESNQEALDELRQELARLGEREADWQQRWKVVLANFDFPPSWDVALATKILRGLSEARNEYNNARELDKRVGDMAEGIRSFEQAVGELCQKLAGDLADELSGQPPEFAVERLEKLLEKARIAQQRHKTLNAEIEKLEKRVTSKRKALEQAEQAIQELLAQGDVETEAAFQQLAVQAQRKAKLQDEVAAAERELAIHRKTEPEEAFLQELEQADADSVAQQQRRLQEEIAASQKEYDALVKDRALADKTRADMEAASEAADLALELEDARSRLAAAAERWGPLMLAQALMKQAIDRFEREHQPAMLAEVQRLFRQLTLDRYVTVERKLDEQGTLLVVQQDGQRKEPAALSTGTREQLYLAIRLAYIRHYCRDAEPLPIVMDDVLVNFDDDRARQTLRVLQEVADNVQILFLTCHQHIMQLASEVQPQGNVLELSAG